MYYQTTFPSPVGEITLGSDEKNLVGLWTHGQKYFGATVPEQMLTHDTLDIFARTRGWLDRYFAGQRPDCSELPLAPMGSPFRQAVWRILREIPYGSVMTYGEIARLLAQRQGIPRMSAQAVGGAVGHNPISILIPCHRVVGANGSLIGFAGGLELKSWLLRHEGADMSRFYPPKSVPSPRRS